MFLKLVKLSDIESTMLLMPLSKGVDDSLLDRNGSIAGPDGLQISLIGAVEIR